MSVDNEIMVMHARLEKAATDAQECSTFMRTQFQQLKTDFQQLAGWQGQNKDAYKTLQDQWDEAADAMYQVLTTIVTATRELNGQYKKWENDMAGQWGGGGGGTAPVA